MSIKARLAKLEQQAKPHTGEPTSIIIDYVNPAGQVTRTETIQLGRKARPPPHPET